MYRLRALSLGPRTAGQDYKKGDYHMTKIETVKRLSRQETKSLKEQIDQIRQLQGSTLEDFSKQILPVAQALATLADSARTGLEREIKQRGKLEKWLKIQIIVVAGLALVVLLQGFLLFFLSPSRQSDEDQAAVRYYQQLNPQDQARILHHLGPKK
jgi:flagellar motility protein MotE (MotC chaperone)